MPKVWKFTYPAIRWYLRSRFSSHELGVLMADAQIPTQIAEICLYRWNIEGDRELNSIQHPLVGLEQLNRNMIKIVRDNLALSIDAEELEAIEAQVSRVLWLYISNGQSWEDLVLGYGNHDNRRPNIIVRMIISCFRHLIRKKTVTKITWKIEELRRTGRITQEEMSIILKRWTVSRSMDRKEMLCNENKMHSLYQLNRKCFSLKRRDWASYKYPLTLAEFEIIEWSFVKLLWRYALGLEAEALPIRPKLNAPS